MLFVKELAVCLVFNSINHYLLTYLLSYCFLTDDEG